MLSRRRVTAERTAVGALVFLAAATGTPARADGAGASQFAGVSCVPGACEAKAKTVKKVPGGRASRGGLEEREGGGAAGALAAGSTEWNRQSGQLLGPRGVPLSMQYFPGPRTNELEPGGGRQVPLKVIVQQAVRKLNLPKPVIRTSPDEDFVQVVHVPTWMWVEQSTWGPVSVSAEVDGVKVIATARPQKTVWSMGDGGEVVCEGPGTPYSGTYTPKASSPDCGYTYSRASLSVPGKAYTVSVRVLWDVEWHGGGQAGVVPGQVMATERQLVVDEVQAIATR